MSLYHEAAEIISLPRSAGGNLKSRVFGKKTPKSPPGQLYALALETCKWSSVLKEVIDNSEILRHERKLTPVLALLLVHDFLLAKGGIALPQSHGFRLAIERHKTRLSSEFNRARLRRGLPNLEALKLHVDSAYEDNYPRWVRINTLRTDLEDQLSTTFGGYDRVYSIKDVMHRSSKSIFIDEHIPNLVAVSPGLDLTKTNAYMEGALILQDKASCFPAYLLDPHAEDGDIIDACASPGNKTTHLAAILRSRLPDYNAAPQTIFAFEKSDKRSLTLEIMVKKAGSRKITKIGFGQDFLEVNPLDPRFRYVGALLLDPSCSGSGIVGRDSMPEVLLPDPPDKQASLKPHGSDNRKRKRNEDEETARKTLVDDDGHATTVASEKELTARLAALSDFQLSLLLHAMKFPAARRITYSTCSVHAEENEHVVIAALQSSVAKDRGWRLLPKAKQVHGLKEWPIRGSMEAASGNLQVADACVRSYKDDGHGIMGFFVACFVRDAEPVSREVEADGPYMRDEEGVIIRDVMGMPVLKSTGQPVSLEDGVIPIDDSESESSDESDEEEDESEIEDESESESHDDHSEHADQNARSADDPHQDEWDGIRD